MVVYGTMYLRVDSTSISTMFSPILSFSGISETIRDDDVVCRDELGEYVEWKGDELWCSSTIVVPWTRSLGSSFVRSTTWEHWTMVLVWEGFERKKKNQRWMGSNRNYRQSKKNGTRRNKRYYWCLKRIGNKRNNYRNPWNRARRTYILETYILEISLALAGDFVQHQPFNSWNMTRHM